MVVVFDSRCLVDATDVAIVGGTSVDLVHGFVCAPCGSWMVVLSGSSLVRLPDPVSSLASCLALGLCTTINRFRVGAGSSLMSLCRIFCNLGGGGTWLACCFVCCHTGECFGRDIASLHAQRPVIRRKSLPHLHRLHCFAGVGFSCPSCSSSSFE